MSESCSRVWTLNQKCRDVIHVSLGRTSTKRFQMKRPGSKPHGQVAVNFSKASEIPESE
jgi:hypothetical protein